MNKTIKNRIMKIRKRKMMKNVIASRGKKWMKKRMEKK